MADLLDRHEAGTVSPIGYPDYASFSDVGEIDRFAQELGEAERSKAVKIAKGRGRNSEQIAHVRLEDASRLYVLLGRRPARELADEATSRLMNGLDLPTEFEAAAASLLAAWSRGRSWQGFSLADVDRLRPAFALAMAILEGRHQGIDYRTFSRRIAGDSKALERLEGPVVRLLGSTLELPPNARPRDALRTLGLEKFAPPMLLSGRIDFDTAELSATAPLYFGISPADAVRVRFRQKPLYLLTIENFASFNRHVAEADPERVGLTIYVGGYPSLATQEALRSLGAGVPDDVRIFHWSDIDPDGTWIFRTIERAVGKPLTPHLMSAELAEKFGKPPAEAVRPSVASETSAISPLVAYLQRNDAKWLEQEELDPVIPQVR
jgi:Wadjet anti plasmid transformation system JetA-like protein